MHKKHLHSTCGRPVRQLVSNASKMSKKLRTSQNSNNITFALMKKNLEKIEFYDEVN